MLDLQRSHTGLLGIGKLQPGNHPARLVPERPEVIELGREPGADEPAVALHQRQLVVKRCRQPLADLARNRPERGDGFLQMGRDFAVAEQYRDVGGGPEPGKDGAEITRSAAIERQP